jgi:exo-rhamnogalacturonan lyase-like protein
MNIKKVYIFLLSLSIVAVCFAGYGSGSDINTRVQELKTTLMKLQDRYTDRHPDVVAVKRKIAELEEHVKQEGDPDSLVIQGRQPKKKVTSNVIASPIKRKKTGNTEEKERTQFYTSEGALRVPVKVKETAGVEVKEHPITAVVPLPFGKYYDTKKFRLVDSSDNTLPAQFKVLNRWWGRDNSIRHLQVNFQPTVSAFTKRRTGVSTYYLRDDGFGNRFETALKVNEADDIITVITGPVKFAVNKKRFNILDEVWLDQNHDRIFEDSEKVISSNAKNGGVFVGRLPGDVQIDSSRTDVTFEIEESGPMRVVIRAEALTKYYNTEKHTHGFAVRIYAYANKPFIKIDYQLQNSAKNKVFAWPLYFEEINLDFRLNLENNARVRFGVGNGSIYEKARGDGLCLAQKFHDAFEIHDKQTKNVLTSGKVPDGFIDISDSQRGVAAMIRYFWQTWPNGLEIDSQNKLSLQLFPSWSSHWMQRKDTPKFTSTGLYWLNDMQHVYKEALLFFHGPKVSNQELISLAKTFQYHPVAIVPTCWYEETQATLDMGGLIPFDKKIDVSDSRIPDYKQYAGYAFNAKKAVHYNFGWNQFLVDVRRKWAPGQGGGWPYSVSALIATENPADYYFAEQFAMGELNVRPQWMAGYIFDEDWEHLQLTENPYGGVSWRKIKGGNFKRHFNAPFLKGTHVDARPRDDEHAWFYHVEEAYYFTCNPWIKDWYKFVAEFRKTRLNHLDPFTDNTTRAVAHSLAHALQAYRITGDTSLIQGFRGYINNWLRPAQHPVNGGIKKMGPSILGWISFSRYYQLYGRSSGQGLAGVLGSL